MGCKVKLLAVKVKQVKLNILFFCLLINAKTFSSYTQQYFTCTHTHGPLSFSQTIKVNHFHLTSKLKLNIPRRIVLAECCVFMTASSHRYEMQTRPQGHTPHHNQLSALMNHLFSFSLPVLFFPPPSTGLLVHFHAQLIEIIPKLFVITPASCHAELIKSFALLLSGLLLCCLIMFKNILRHFRQNSVKLKEHQVKAQYQDGKESAIQQKNRIKTKNYLSPVMDCKIIS